MPVGLAAWKFGQARRPLSLLLPLTLGGCGPYLNGRGPSPPSITPISARLGGGEGLWPTLLGTLEGPSRRRDPLEGGDPSGGG